MSTQNRMFVYFSLEDRLHQTPVFTYKFYVTDESDLAPQGYVLFKGETISEARKYVEMSGWNIDDKKPVTWIAKDVDFIDGKVNSTFAVIDGNSISNYDFGNVSA